MNIESVCLCKCGLQRESNQDRAMTFTAKDRSLSFVADGVGGHYAGEMASEIVMSALCRWWE